MGQTNIALASGSEPRWRGPSRKEVPFGCWVGTARKRPAILPLDGGESVLPVRVLFPSGRDRASASFSCYVGGMSTYIVTQDNATFHVREGDAKGPVLATFSNKLAAERFAENRAAADNAVGAPPKDKPA
jgi:hypothetical protein